MYSTYFRKRQTEETDEANEPRKKAKKSLETKKTTTETEIPAIKRNSIHNFFKKIQSPEIKTSKQENATASNASENNVELKSIVNENSSTKPESNDPICSKSPASEIDSNEEFSENKARTTDPLATEKNAAGSMGNQIGKPTQKNKNLLPKKARKGKVADAAATTAAPGTIPSDMDISDSSEFIEVLSSVTAPASHHTNPLFRKRRRRRGAKVIESDDSDVSVELDDLEVDEVEGEENLEDDRKERRGEKPEVKKDAIPDMSEVQKDQASIVMEGEVDISDHKIESKPEEPSKVQVDTPINQYAPKAEITTPNVKNTSPNVKNAFAMMMKQKPKTPKSAEDKPLEATEDTQSKSKENVSSTDEARKVENSHEIGIRAEDKVNEVDENKDPKVDEDSKKNEDFETPSRKPVVKVSLHVTELFINEIF